MDVDEKIQPVQLDGGSPSLAPWQHDTHMQSSPSPSMYFPSQVNGVPAPIPAPGILKGHSNKKLLSFGRRVIIQTPTRPIPTPMSSLTPIQRSPEAPWMSNMVPPPPNYHIHPPPPPPHLLVASPVSVGDFEFTPTPQASVPPPVAVTQQPQATTTQSGTVIIKKVLPKVVLPPGLQAKAAAAAAARGELLHTAATPQQKTIIVQPQEKPGILGMGTEKCNEAQQLLIQRVRDNNALQFEDVDVSFSAQGITDKSMKGFIRCPAPRGPYMITPLGRLSDPNLPDEERCERAHESFETFCMQNEDKYPPSPVSNEPQRSCVDVTKAVWNINNRDVMSRTYNPYWKVAVPLPIPDYRRPEIVSMGRETLLKGNERKFEPYTDSESSVDMDSEIVVEPDSQPLLQHPMAMPQVTNPSPVAKSQPGTLVNKIAPLISINHIANPFGEVHATKDEDSGSELSDWDLPPGQRVSVNGICLPSFDKLPSKFGFDFQDKSAGSSGSRSRSVLGRDSEMRSAERKILHSTENKDGPPPRLRGRKTLLRKAREFAMGNGEILPVALDVYGKPLTPDMVESGKYQILYNPNLRSTKKEIPNPGSGKGITIQKGKYSSQIFTDSPDSSPSVPKTAPMKKKPGTIRNQVQNKKPPPIVINRGMAPVAPIVKNKDWECPEPQHKKPEVDAWGNTAMDWQTGGWDTPNWNTGCSNEWAGTIWGERKLNPSPNSYYGDSKRLALPSKPCKVIKMTETKGNETMYWGDSNKQELAAIPAPPRRNVVVRSRSRSLRRSSSRSSSIKRPDNYYWNRKSEQLKAQGRSLSPYSSSRSASRSLPRFRPTAINQRNGIRSRSRSSNRRNFRRRTDERRGRSFVSSSRSSSMSRVR